MTFLSRRRRASSPTHHARFHNGIGAGRHRSLGQALVEFVLILPVMLLLLLIAIDFGRLFFSYIQINNAAREAAYYASHAPTNNAGITNVAGQETNSQKQVGESAIVVTTSCKNSVGIVLASCSLATGGASGPGNSVTVSVDERFTFLTPLIGAMFSNLHLIADSTATVTDYASSSGGSPPAGCALPVPSFVVTVTSGMTVFADPTASRPNSGVCNISGFNWRWDSDPDNDTVGTATGDSHTYLTPGTYIITLEVTNQAGAAEITGSVTVPVLPTVPPCVAPTANFSWTSSGKSRTYTDTSTVLDPVNCPITDWLWTFTDLGTQSNAQNPATQTYGNNSGHPVTLRVTNAGGSTTITKTS